MPDIPSEENCAAPEAIAPSEPLALFEKERLRHLTANFGAFSLTELFGSLGIGFISLNTILPVLLARLRFSKFLIGLLPCILQAGTCGPQLVGAYATSSLPRKKKSLVYLHVLSCLALGALAVGTFFVSVERQLLSGLLVFLPVGIFSLAMGLITPIFADMTAKLIPTTHRGRLWGLLFTVNAGFAMVGAFLARFLLAGFDFPRNFGLSFCIGATLFGVCIMGLLFLREPPLPEIYPRRRFFPFVGRLFRQTYEDRNYRNYLTSRALTGFGYMALGFLTICATERFSLPSSAAATYTMVLFAGQGTTSIFMGAVGERKGYRFLSLLASSCWIVSLLFALFAPSSLLFALALFTGGMALATDNIAVFNFIFESCRELDKSGYISLANLLVSPMFMSAPLIGGFLIDNFSYTAMFLTSLATHGIAFGILLFFVADPRFLYMGSTR